MMASKSAVRPVWQVFAEDGEQPRSRKSFLPAVASYFSDNAGKLLALPFNISTPILFYNKDAFRKAKLDPEQAAEDLVRDAQGDGRAGRARATSASTPRSGPPGCRSRT